MAESYSVEAVLKAVDAGFGEVFENAANMADTFGKRASTNLGKTGQMMTNVGSTLTKGITVPLALVGVAAAKTAMDFDAQMSRVQAIAGATGKQTAALKKEAIQLGAKTQFSAKQAASGMENLASAGMNSNQIMSAMPGVLNLAAVSGGDVAAAAEDASTALNAFGLSASDSGHVADVFAKAAAKTNAEASDMGEALKYVAPGAHAAGQSIETTAAAIGVLSDAGIKGTMAGTSLNQVFEQLGKPTTEAAKAMQKIGFSAYDANGKMKPLPKLVSDYAKATKGMTAEQKQYYLATIFGTQGGRAMNAMLAAGAPKLAHLTKELQNSDGAANKMAKTMQKNAKNAIEQLGGALESAAIVIGDKMAPAITAVANWLGDLVSKFTNASPKIQNFILIMLGIAAAVGPIILVAGKMLIFANNVRTAAAAFKAFGGASSALGAVLKALPIIALVAAIALLAVGFVKLYNSSATFRKIVNDIGSALNSIFGPAIKFVSGQLQSFASWVKKTADSMSSSQKAVVAIAGGIGLLGDAFVLAKGGIGGLLGKLVGLGGSATKAANPMKALGGVSSNLGINIGVAAAGIGVMALGIAKFASTGKQGTSALIAMSVAVAALAGVFALLGGPLTAGAVGIGVFGAAILAIGAGIAVASLGIAALINSFANLLTVMASTNTSSQQLVATAQALGLAFGTMILTAITTVITGLGTLAVAFMTSMVQISVAVAQGAPLIVQNFLLMITNILTTITAALPSLIAAGASLIVNFITGITTALPGIIVAATNLIVTFLNGITQNLPTVMAAALALIVAFLNGIAQGLPQVMAAATNVIVNFLNGLASNMGSIVSAGANLIANFLNGLAANMGQIITAGVNAIVAFINGVASNLGRVITAAVNLIGKFILGLVNAIPQIASIAVQAVGRFVYGVGNALGQVLGSGTKLIGMFVKGIMDGFGQTHSAGSGAGKSGASGLKSVGGLFSSAGHYLMSGFVSGIESMAGSVMSAAAGIASKAAGMIRKALKIHSPSRVTFGFGAYFSEGFLNGIISLQSSVLDTASKMGSNVSDALNNSLNTVTPSLNTNSLASTVNGLNSRSANLGVVSTMTMKDSTLQMQNNALLRQIANKDGNVYMSNGRLVGAIGKDMDEELGARVGYKSRWER
jgi:TP901 family phage tail tape measure protein